MVEYFKQVNTEEFGLNLFNDFLSHKQRVVRAAQIQQAFGVDPNRVIAKAIGDSRLRLKSKLDSSLDSQYSNLAKDLQVKMQLIAGKAFVDDAFISNIGSVLNQTMSLITAAPARSTVRNLFIDYEANALAVGNSLYNGNFNLGGTAQRVFKNMSHLVRLAIGNPERKQGINDLLEIAGWANNLDGLFQGNILAFEDVITTADSNRAVQASSYLNQKISSMQDSLFRWSGNHALLDMVRARRFVSLQQSFSNVIKHTDYDTWRGSLNEAEKQQLDFLSSNFGLNENTFQFFKKANKVDTPITSGTAKDLGVGNIPSYLSKQSILDTPDDIARKYANKNETPKQFKERMANNWQKFIYTSTTKFAPVPNVVDSLTAPLTQALPAWATLPLRPFLKFADVAHAQFADLAESIAIAVYGRPDQFIGFDKSLVAWGKALSTYIAFAAATIWTKDLLNNRAPTNFTERNKALRLMAISGFGGYHMMAASNFLGIFPNKGSSSLYASTPLGAGIADIRSFKKALDSKKNKAGKLGLALHRANPYTQLWYASGVVEYGLNKILLSPVEQRQKYRNFERYGKPYLF